MQPLVVDKAHCLREGVVDVVMHNRAWPAVAADLLDRRLCPGHELARVVAALRYPNDAVLSDRANDVTACRLIGVAGVEAIGRHPIDRQGLPERLAGGLLL